MEVIHRGELPEQKRYQAECNYCRSVMRFQRSEAEYVSDQRDGDCLKVICPVCDRPVYVAVRAHL